MDETAARAVVLVRAIETADGGRELWSDADRTAAGRAAAQAAGESSPADALVARRAELVLERLARRYPKVRTLARPRTVGRWVAPLAAGAAFVIGAAGVEIGPDRRINLLAPPVLALLVWNVAVYAMLMASVVTRGRAPGTASREPLRQAIAAMLGGSTSARRAANAPRALAAGIARFASDWPSCAAPLWRWRAARLLHVCAAALAAGAIAGLYVRGIALEYRASWQSTFLDADDVARLLHAVLWPGSRLTGIAIPNADHLRLLSGAGENAAAWIHLYAATIVAIVIVPRLALAAAAALRERQLSRRFPLPLDDAYFQRLLRAWREGTARVAAIAYSYTVVPVAADGLARAMTRAFEAAVDIEWLPPVAYGADEYPALPVSPLSAVVAVFGLGATPEEENHGAFLRALAARAAGRAPVVAVVDVSEFAERFRGEPRRLAEREQAWREMLAAHDVDPLFARLADPDLPRLAADLAGRLERNAP